MAKETSKSERGNEKFYRKKNFVILFSSLMISCALICVAIAIILLRGNNCLDSKVNKEISDSQQNIETVEFLPKNESFKFVSRSEWIAMPPRNDLTDSELPIKRIIIASTSTEFCSTQAVCIFRTRLIQTFHMESRHWDDIGYNFLVGGDGAAYEGRGWDKQGAHTKGFNRGSICIAFIGTFNDITPNDRQLKAAKLLIEEGLRLGKLSSDYKLYGHRQLVPTESPGIQVYNIIKTWDHWSEEPVIA